MRTAPPSLLPIFRSEAQARMLSRLLLEPAADATARDLQQASGMSAASLHRELERAERAGIITRDRSRRPHIFRANRENPAFEHLAALLRPTLGVEAEVTKVLSEIPDIELALIHGSWLDGTARSTSDVDLLVVGNADRQNLRRRLRALSAELGREIDVSVVKPEDFRELVASGNAFVAAILRRPHLVLAGDLDDTLSGR